VSTDSKTPIRVMRIIARMNVGGPAVQVSGLMRGFNLQIFDQRLYTGFCADDEADYIDSVAMDVKATRVNSLGRRVTLIGDLSAFITLVLAIRSFKPHIIHTHTAKAGFLGRIASIVSLYPSIRIHTFHGHLLSGYFGAYKRRLVIAAEKVLAIFTHELLAVGDKVRQDLLDAGIGYPDKFEVMPPGLEIGFLPSKLKSREFFGLSNKTLQCAFIGRVTQIKRPDRFLDVVSELKNRGTQVEFIMAGDGDRLSSCKERIRHENLPVKALGWQSNIERVLAASDIVMLSSDNEGTPLSLIQAGMAGLPVVTIRVGSIAEVVLDGVTGMITSLDVQELADAIEKLVNDAKLRREMGDAAKEFTLNNFGVQQLVRNHERLYERLLKN
jgi:glycosyltransferase involved in cell wall biosynthesis